MKLLRPFDELRFRFGYVGVGDADVYRAYRRACFLVVKADTFGALLGNDVEDLGHEGRLLHAVEIVLHSPLVNCRIGALGFAGTAVDAVAGDHGRHGTVAPKLCAELGRVRVQQTYDINP
jgi:hypothetical protein